MNLKDMQPFCSVDETRQRIRTPFTLGAHTYATDGRILIRVPAIEGARTDNLPEKPHKLIPDPTGYYPVKFPPGWESFRTPLINCEACGGTGKLTKCRHCNGTGEIECLTCGHEEECGPCGGTGVGRGEKLDGPDCEDCEGKGEYEGAFAVGLNHGTLAADLRYLHLAHTLPGMKLKYLDEMSVMHIEFAGGDGALMPMRKRDNEGIPLKAQWPELNVHNAEPIHGAKDSE